jgi:hypothetical protein
MTGMGKLSKRGSLLSFIQNRAWDSNLAGLLGDKEEPYLKWLDLNHPLKTCVNIIST